MKPPKKDSKGSSSKQPQKTQKKKEGGAGGKAKKKKWSKGKVRDKLNNQVLFDKATYEKLLKEVPSYKLITPSVVSERLKVRGSLARRALDELLQKEYFEGWVVSRKGISFKVQDLSHQISRRGGNMMDISIKVQYLSCQDVRTRSRLGGEKRLAGMVREENEGSEESMGWRLESRLKGGGGLQGAEQQIQGQKLIEQFVV
uniref:Small ribosomal subunit protein eS25 n=1 Tax=Timema douglasi TaxID=61478 RepID=A0A7R8Z9G8_TIMDO|nr:unnamed protein product [Timema douglasi]